MTTRRFATTGVIALATLAMTSLGAPTASSVPTAAGGLARSSDAGTVAATRIFKYDIEASYVLTGEEVDPTTSLRRTSEWRIDWQYPTMGVAASKGAFFIPTGYSRGTVRISVRDERTSTPCERTVEGVNAIDVSMGISTKGSRVSLQRKQTRPDTPCPPSFYHDALLVTSGALSGSRANQGGVSVRLTDALDPGFLADVTAGRSAATTIELTPATASRAGVTLRAVVTLSFTRNTSAEPKPSNKALVVSKPRVECCGYEADVWLVLTRGGDPIGTTRATCTGGLTGGARLEGKPVSSVLPISELMWRAGGKRLLKRWPLLAPYEGKPVTLVSCRYEVESLIRACGKTVRGGVTLVVDGRTITRSFSFVWATPHIKWANC